MPDRFLTCILENLQKKGTGAARTQAVGDMYTRYLNIATREGHASPGQVAMDKTMTMLASEKKMKLIKMEKQLQLVTRTKDMVANASKMTLVSLPVVRIDEGKGIGGKIGAVRRGIFEVDPRVGGEMNVYGAQESIRTKYFAMTGDAIRFFMKDWKGTHNFPGASMRNIVRELFGVDSGDRNAKVIAEGFTRIQKVSLDDLRRVGAMIHELTDFHLPQWQSIVRMRTATMAEWVKDHIDWIDWNKTLYPDGTLIPKADQERVLQHVYYTITTHGKSDIDVDGVSGGQGKAMGNMIDSERFLHYKSADTWWAMHEKYMDGNVMDTLTRFIDRRASQVGTMQVLGPNPASGIQIINSITQRAAADAEKTATTKLDARATEELEKSNKRFGIMADTILHKHPLDINITSATVSTTTNLASAALLKSAIFISVATDLVNTLAIRWAQNQHLTGFMGAYMRTMFPGGAKANSELMAQTGFVQREVVSNNYVAARYGMGTMYGTPITNRISEAAMRLTLLQRHTLALRAANQQELMGALWRERDLSLANTKTTKAMLTQAGITEKEWDFVRNNIKAWEPMNGARFMRPLDILDLKHADKHDMYGKFHQMIINQSQMMTPYTTAEARAILTRGLRPDSLSGAALHSMAMYHGYPLTMALMVGRMLAGGPDIGVSRVKLAVAMGLGSLLAGAVGSQLRDMVYGREPQPMDNPGFWVRAFFSSASFPVIGDLLVAGLGTDPQRSVMGAIAGPLGNEMGALVEIAMSPFGWADIGDRNTPAAAMFRKTVDFAERFVIPATFYTYLPMERAFLDKVREWGDPVGTARSRRSQIALQRNKYGRGFWSPPGSGLESLLP